MYTVIIAEKQFLDLVEDLKIFLEPLLVDSVVFCEWHRDGKNAEEMLPDLPALIRFHKEWRAVVVNEDGLTKINPFDLTAYRDAVPGPVVRGGYEALLARRRARLESCEKAVLNPLVRLGVALAGVPAFNNTVEDEKTLDSILSGETDLRRYMLSGALAEADLPALATRLELYSRERLLRFVGEEKVDALLDAVRADDEDAVASLVGEEALPEFLWELTAGDPTWSDLEYCEGRVENSAKKRYLETLARDYTLRDSLPGEVYCFSPRTCDFEDYLLSKGAAAPDETAYSHFAEFNLYADRLRFFVYDLVSPDHSLYGSERLKMLACLLVLAANPLPQGAAAPGKVYALKAELDGDALKAIFSHYLGRLKATDALIRETDRDLERESALPLDDRTSRELFENEVRIPVETVTLTAPDCHVDTGKIGLAGDCPEEELAVWSRRYKESEKRFSRYLREPPRALKAAVVGPFRDQRRIDDERMFRLNENQREDVRIRMLEEEEAMTATVTPGVFDEETYKKELREADEEVRGVLGKRLTKARTLTVGGVALGAYLLGFLPLFFGNLNTGKSVLFCLAMTLGALALFAAAGLVYLFWRRRTVKRALEGYNRKVTSLFGRIGAGLAAFTRYLQHASNVMRASSVLSAEESAAVRKRRILRHHLNEIREASDKAVAVFSRFMDCSAAADPEAEPYAADYTEMFIPAFPVPFPEDTRNIEFLQPGCTAAVAGGFVLSISSDRVEIYD